MAVFTSRSCSHLLILAVLLYAAYGLEFVAQPTNQTVAPDSLARFNCVARGKRLYVRWIVDEIEYMSQNLPKGYNATTTSDNGNIMKSVLMVTARHNGTSIICRVANAADSQRSRVGHLNIAAPPLTPYGLKVNYNRFRGAVELEWNEPFTHLPQFPILGYQAEVEFFTMEQTRFKMEKVDLSDTETSFSHVLNESEICNSSRVCISLRAQNEVGYSLETETTCTNIERVHSPLPVNTTLSKHSDGQTLVSVIFEVPRCFPQAMQPTVFVEEAHLPQDSELTPEPLIPEEGAHLMESYVLTLLEQDVVYSVVVMLKSQTDNTTSQPVYVTLPAQATTSDDEGGGTIAGIVVAFLLLMFIIAALAVAFTVFVIMHKRRKDVTMVNHMQPNPFYENTYYDSIADANSPPPVRSPSYDSHIYQDMPELVCRLHANGTLRNSSLSQPPSSCIVPDDSSSLEEMKRVQTVVAEAAGERESEYITMHSVTEPVPVLQTDV